MYKIVVAILLLMSGLSGLHAQNQDSKDVLGVQIEYLAQTTDAEFSVKEKYFRLIDIYLIAIKEAIKAETAKNIVLNLETFESKNKAFLDKLFLEVNVWQQQMNEEERRAFKQEFMMRESSADFFLFMMQLRNRVGENPAFMKKFERLYPMN